MSAHSQVGDAAASGSNAGRFPFVLMGLVLACGLIAWPTTSSLLRLWANTERTTYTHGILIAGVSLWLLYVNRHRLCSLPRQTSFAAAVMLAIVSVVWLILLRAGIEIGHQALLPIMIWLAIYTAFGRRIAIASAFAIAYLYFALPAWESINGILQRLTVEVVAVAVRISSIPAFVEGNTVHLVAGAFEIAGGCSGLHFFIVATALAALYGELQDDGIRARIKLLSLAVGIAIVTNWLRVYIIIVAGYLTDMQHYLVRVDHYRFGWVLFAATMAIFFFIARRLPSSDAPVNSEPPIAISSSRLLSSVPLALAVLAIGPCWNMLRASLSRTPGSLHAALPSNPGAWQGPQLVTPSEWKPSFPAADLDRFGVYTHADRRVDLYVASYGSQAQGRELIGEGNSILGRNLHEVQHSRMADEQVVEQIAQSPNGDRWVIRHTYRIGEYSTDQGIVAQLLYGVLSLSGAPVSSVTAFGARCVPDCTAAGASLSEFAAAMAASNFVSERT